MNKQYTIICIAYEKGSVMVVDVDASTIEIALKATAHFSDMETGCGPYCPELIFEGLIKPPISGRIFNMGNGDEYLDRIEKENNSGK